MQTAMQLQTGNSIPKGKAATIDGLSTWILDEEDIKNVHEMLTNP